MMHCRNSAGQNLCIYKESLLMTMDFFRHIPQTIYNAFIHSKSSLDILFRQITTFIKVFVAFVFRIHIL